MHCYYKLYLGLTFITVCCNRHHQKLPIKHPDWTKLHLRNFMDHFSCVGRVICTVHVSLYV